MVLVISCPCSCPNLRGRERLISGLEKVVSKEKDNVMIWRILLSFLFFWKESSERESRAICRWWSPLTWKWKVKVKCNFWLGFRLGRWTSKVANSWEKQVVIQHLGLMVLTLLLTNIQTSSIKSLIHSNFSHLQESRTDTWTCSSYWSWTIKVLSQSTQRTKKEKWKKADFSRVLREKCNRQFG